MKKRHALSVAVVTVATALTACGPDEAGNGDSGADYAVGKGDQYVALGDSYTAAPNTAAGDEADGCLRSTINYPHRIAEATGVELFDNSCAGASTSSISGPQLTAVSERPPQIEDIGPDTDLVTVRLGANDYSMFVRIVLCERTHDPDEPGSPCSDADRALTGGTDVASRSRDVADNLERGLEEIRDRAPDARIIVVGYPRFAPDEGTCELLPIPAGDYDYVRRIFEGFNSAAQSAADAVDATFIDVYAASEGHDICSDEPWIAGARVVKSGATPWHPYPQESQAVARLVLEELEK